MPIRVERQSPVIINAEAMIPNYTFTSVGMIGDGQTSRMFKKVIGEAFPELPITVIKRSTPEQNTFAVLKDNPPQLLILATPEPTDEVLQTIADNIDKTDPKLTLMLPQNGTAVAKKARAILGDKVNLVRASVFSSASWNGNDVDYDQEKLRIGFAAIPDSSGNISEENKVALSKTERLYRKSGFDTLIFANYETMELEKAFLNLVGMTGALVGLTTEETFADLDLYKLDVRAWHDRLRILKAANIDIKDIPWGGAPQLPILDSLPKPIQNFPPVRHFVGSKISKGRNRKPSSIMLGIQNARPTEALFYLETFIKLGEKFGLRSPIDEAMRDIIQRHNHGEINLANLSQHKRKRLLFEAIDERYPQAKKDNGLKQKLGRAFGEFSLNTMGVEIVHPERLDDLKDTLKTKSVIAYGNHHGKADGIPYLATMLQAVPSDHIVVVLGMKQYDRIQGPLQKYIQGPLFKATAETYKAHMVLMMTDEDKHYPEEEKARFNAEALEELNHYLSQPGYMVLIYPEGTRSHNRLLQAGKRGLELILRKNRDTAVAMPIGCEYHGVYPYGQDTRMVLGTPATYDDLNEDLDMSNKLHPELKGSKILNRTEILMAKLANLVMPRNWGSHYQELFAKYPELSNPDPEAGIDRYY